MSKIRQPVSQKARFEVFKRDKFTCQYCGAKAPDVLLHVDHIKPVADGGLSDILNLVTACAICNGGKGARALSDGSAVEKQRSQIEELQERRHQLEMLLEWRAGLADLGVQKQVALERAICVAFDATSLTEQGRSTLRKWLVKYDLIELLEAFEISRTQYLVHKDDWFTKESLEKAFHSTPKIAAVRRAEKDKPYLKDLLYIRAILRNRMYVGEIEARQLLEEAFLAGCSADHLKSIAKDAYNWSAWRDFMVAAINAGRRK